MHSPHSRHRTHRPSFLDKVYVKSRLKENKQPNGYVLKVDWSERKVIVKFLSSKYHASDIDEFDLDDFEHRFRNAFNGTWFLDI